MKKGQVTIFIILGIVLVFGVFLVFFLRGDIELKDPIPLGPQEFVRSCIEEELKPAIQIVTENGGRINPKHYINYSGEKYNYLCYSGDFYTRCYNTHTMLELIVEKEILEETKEGVENCFNKMKVEFEKRGYTVSGSSMSYSLDLVPGRLDIYLNKKVVLSHEDTSSTYEDFDLEITSSLYDLISITRDIVNSESQFCYADYNGYMLLYPRYDLRRIDYLDSKIYIVRDRRSNEEIKFAVRSCAVPSGFI